MQKIYIFGSQMRYSIIQKFVGEPQDHYQSTLNFHTLLLICKGNFPSLLEMKMKKKILTIHPNPYSVAIDSSNDYGQSSTKLCESIFHNKNKIRRVRCG